MKIILLNKTCEYHKLVFATELIFCNNAKSNWKNPIDLLSWEPRAMLTSGLAYKNMSSLHRSILHVISMCLIVDGLFLLSCEVSLLGRSEDADLYEDLEEYENLAAPAGVRVFRFQAPLYYANKDSFLRTLYEAIGVDPFLETTRRRKAEKKAAKRLAAKQTSKDDLENQKNGELCKGLVPRRELDFHTIVLDCSAIPFIDSAGTGAFVGLVKDYGEVGVGVLLAGCNTPVIDALRRGAFFGEKDRDMGLRLFYTVHAAVLSANRRAAAAGRAADDSQV